MTTTSARDALLALAARYDTKAQNSSPLVTSYTWVAAAEMARTAAAACSGEGGSPAEAQPGTGGGDGLSGALRAAVGYIRAAQGDEFARREAWVIQAAVEATSPVIRAAERKRIEQRLLQECERRLRGVEIGAAAEVLSAIADAVKDSP